MTERKIKAYGLLGSIEYVERNYDAETRKNIFDAFSPELRNWIPTSKKAHWAPPLFSCEVWRGIVKAQPDPTKATNDLYQCGRHMGSYATNTYLKLLLKMLTIKMFAKKFPDIWARDANFGKLSIDIAELESGKLIISMTGLENYPYFGPICQGWYSFSFETMGLKNVKVELKNWSIQTPDPGHLEYHVLWTR
jgi:hypothetical protein